MSVVAIVQARMGSSRLPGKVLREVGGVPMIDLLLERLRRTRLVDRIVVATTDRPGDDVLARHLEQIGQPCFRGHETDVLDRYLRAAWASEASTVVRITGDCPLVDPEVVDRCVEAFAAGGVDYLSNIDPPTLPDGLDTEVFSVQALERAAAETNAAHDREHVTPYLRSSGRFRTGAVRNDDDRSGVRLTVDEPQDLELVSRIFAHFAPDRHFPWQAVIALRDRNPELFQINGDIRRNEGASMSSGQKLWKRAKRVIPGGNMLLSKRAEMFLPEKWPAYFDRAEGCTVWDLDGREYLDMSLMGIGTNVLGYGHSEVDAAVRETVTKGNMSTLNCPEEVWLAERLVEIDAPWAGMVRLARSGGEANAIAIRIARAASGRDKVAFCGYHGWHDWYLSANLGDSHNLAGHLLPGLDPAGVPQALRGQVVPFNYNDFEALERIAADDEVGVIKMEVVRNAEPAEEFLDRIREIATARGIVLIFDECTSGFREAFGGLHKKYGVEPDIAVYGKTLGNGYAITAVVGRREVMEAAQSTFISSTFWTERIGPAAALKALEVMERERSWETITAAGHAFRERLQAVAAAHGVPIALSGLPSLTSFAVQSRDALAYKTLITQEMLKKGILAGTGIYLSVAHRPEHFDRYFEAIGPVMALIAECEAGRDVMKLLEGPVCHAGFRRLN